MIRRWILIVYFKYLDTYIAKLDLRLRSRSQPSRWLIPSICSWRPDLKSIRIFLGKISIDNRFIHQLSVALILSTSESFTIFVLGWMANGVKLRAGAVHRAQVHNIEHEYTRVPTPESQCLLPFMAELTTGDIQPKRISLFIGGSRQGLFFVQPHSQMGFEIEQLVGFFGSDMFRSDQFSSELNYDGIHSSRCVRLQTPWDSHAPALPCVMYESHDIPV